MTQTLSFDLLTLSFPPPEVPLDLPSDDRWGEVETALGIVLPIDYKAYVRRYGTGRWFGFLWVLSPFAVSPSVALPEIARAERQRVETLRRDRPAVFPFDPFPARNGIFPWARTDAGHRLYWLTQGDSAEWPIVVLDPAGKDFELHDLSCTEFLLRWAMGERQVRLFPDDLPHGDTKAFSAERPPRTL